MILLVEPEGKYLKSYHEAYLEYETNNINNYEELATKLNVTRQAVSSWETGKNLLDIEILINISNVFNISLEQLIKDGSDTRRARYNMVMVIIGTFLLCIGVMMIVIKGLSVEYIDAEGFLHVLWFSVFCGRRH
ncbi:MAG: helix-turn-helix domain-containing protein [Erysipelotrichaceae bacterium]